MGRKDARTKVGDYVRLAQQIYGMNGTASDFYKVLNQLRDLGSNGYKIEDAVANLRKNDCYNDWEEELRYFMSRYEENLAQGENQDFSNEQWDRIWMASPASSIEHIHPQNPATAGPWKGALGRGRGQREAHVNRLGNLVLLPPGLNSKLGNQGFTEKKEAYRKTGLLLLQDVVRKKTWTKQAIEEREEELLCFAEDQWADL